MDPYAPINGITLERYAELSAEVAETQDPDKQAEIVAKLGVSREDWEAAKSGWTLRMQDMALMGAVATRFMPLYQAALAKKSPAPQVSFDDYVAMSGAVPVLGFEGMLGHYKLTPAQWTQIAGHWNNTIPTHPQYQQYGVLVQQEAARIRAGGAPKPVSFGAPGAAPGPAPGPGAYAPQPYAQPGYAQPGYAQPGYAQPGYPQHNAYAGANPFGTPHQQQAFDAQAQKVGSEIGNAFLSFGNAMGSLVDGAMGAFAPGTRVLVQWSDGNRYPATVTMFQNGQVQVAFPDGRQVWVPQQYVSIG